VQDTLSAVANAIGHIDDRAGVSAKGEVRGPLRLEVKDVASTRALAMTHVPHRTTVPAAYGMYTKKPGTGIAAGSGLFR
jgi:hypothetical protein